MTTSPPGRSAVWGCCHGEKTAVVRRRGGTSGLCRLRTWETPSSCVRALTSDSRFTVVDLTANKTIRSIPSDYFSAEGVCFSPDGSRLAFSGTKGVGIVSLNSDSEPRWLRFEPEWQQRFTASDKMTPSRIVLLTNQVKVQLEKQAGRQPALVRVLEQQSGLILASFRAGAEASEKSELLSPTGSVRVEVEELALFLRDQHSGSIQNILPRPEGPICLLAFTRDGTRLAAAGVKGVNLWDARTGVELLTWRSESKPGQSSKTPRHLGFDDESNALVLVGKEDVVIYPHPRRESLDSSTRWDLLHLLQAERSFRWEEAGTCLTRLLRAQPANQPLRLRQVRALMARKRFSEAVAELRRGTELAPAADTPVGWWLSDGILPIPTPPTKMKMVASGAALGEAGSGSLGSAAPNMIGDPDDEPRGMIGDPDDEDDEPRGMVHKGSRDAKSHQHE